MNICSTPRRKGAMLDPFRAIGYVLIAFHTFAHEHIITFVTSTHRTSTHQHFPIMATKEKLSGNRLRLYEIVFESDTRPGRLYDIVLLFCIVASVVVVALESVPS